MAQTHEPLTSERLREMRLVTEPPATQAWRDRRDLLREVGRLQAALAAAEAREAQWRKIGQAVADGGAEASYTVSGVSWLVFCPGDDAEDIRDKARALLAATEAVES